MGRLCDLAKVIELLSGRARIQVQLVRVQDSALASARTQASNTGGGYGLVRGTVQESEGRDDLQVGVRGNFVGQVAFELDLEGK